MKLTFYFEGGVLDGGKTEREFPDYPPVGLEIDIGWCYAVKHTDVIYAAPTGKQNHSLYVIRGIKPGEDGNAGDIFCISRRVHNPNPQRRSER